MSAWRIRWKTSCGALRSPVLSEHGLWVDFLSQYEWLIKFIWYSVLVRIFQLHSSIAAAAASRISEILRFANELLAVHCERLRSRLRCLLSRVSTNSHAYNMHSRNCRRKWNASARKWHGILLANEWVWAGAVSGGACCLYAHRCNKRRILRFVLAFYIRGARDATEESHWIVLSSLRLWCRWQHAYGFW